MTHASNQGLSLCSINAVQVTESRTGAGLTGVVDGWTVKIGNAGYVFGESSAATEGGFLARKMEACMDNGSKAGTGGMENGEARGVEPMSSELAAYFSMEREPAAGAGQRRRARGWIYCHDEIRPSALAMVKRLQGEYKLRCLILSGDRTTALQHVAQCLGERGNILFDMPASFPRSIVSAFSVGIA